MSVDRDAFETRAISEGAHSADRLASARRAFETRAISEGAHSLLNMIATFGFV